MKPKNHSGFTIIELLIATTIFSAVLLLALNGFFQIGKIYYKGVANTQTHGVAQNIVTDISTALQFSLPVVGPADSSTSGIKYLCLGNSRYTFQPFKQANLAAEDIPNKNFGLVRDYLTGAGSCGDPFPASGTNLKNPTELLGSKMRLSKLCIVAVNGGSGTINTSGETCPPPASCTSVDAYNPCLTNNNLSLINVVVAYGDNEILNGYNTANPSCNSSATNSQYCSVANLQVVINRGYGN